jgi:hypothetical protein
MFPVHLGVKVVGAPRRNERLREIGLKVLEIAGFGDPSQREYNFLLALRFH